MSDDVLSTLGKPSQLKIGIILDLFSLPKREFFRREEAFPDMWAIFRICGQRGFEMM